MANRVQRTLRTLTSKITIYFSYFFKSINKVLKITWWSVYHSPTVLWNSKQFLRNLGQYKSR